MRKCSQCQEDLPATDEFFASRKDRKKPLLQGICRTCQAKYRKKHYADNKQKYIDKAAAYTEKFKVWFTELKSKMSCKSCGENRWWVLDFHHRNPAEKEEELSTLIRKCSKKKIEAELAKCDVLCANCHRDLHHKERQAVIS